MSKFDLLHALKERGALLDGHFRLSSGRHSNRFVQKFRILESPPLVEAVARAIADAFRDVRPTIVVSAAVGGIVLGYEVARQLGTDAIFVEKENGVAMLRRSFHLDSSDRVLVVEDVVTTGMSVREVIDVVRSYGASVAGVGVIVERGSVDFGVPTHALLELP
ncbi:MAG TPA: orotate phosphoribosyltransferase, partial [Candidatus Baltobacteraceae bacterium]|nr:orotate phosphoribosyltransferase [Candidatus Baltobacteraceae bacterium]